jgi:hypothetical protein
VTKRGWVVVADPPKARGDLQLQRESMEDRTLRVLGLRVLRVEIRVNGTLFYRGFLPKS